MAPEGQTTGPGSLGRQVRRAMTGVVEAISGTATIRVQVEHLVKHTFYDKYIRRRTRLLVHDPKNEAKVGDAVEVVPCRPISKRKSWRLLRVLKRARSA